MFDYKEKECEEGFRGLVESVLFEGDFWAGGGMI